MSYLKKPKKNQFYYLQTLIKKLSFFDKTNEASPGQSMAKIKRRQGTCKIAAPQKKSRLILKRFSLVFQIEDFPTRSKQTSIGGSMYLIF